MWLLVEDDPDIRTVVSLMMMMWGETPLEFPDGGAAWDWLDKVETGTYSGALPDLALMDIKMPGYTGDQVAARIRTVSPLKDIPIILMTAFTKNDAEIEGLKQKAGIDHLMNKPLPDMDVFRDLIYGVRDQKRAKNAAQAQAPSLTPPAASVTNGSTPASPAASAAPPAPTPAPVTPPAPQTEPPASPAASAAPPAPTPTPVTPPTPQTEPPASPAASAAPPAPTPTPVTPPTPQTEPPASPAASAAPPAPTPPSTPEPPKS